MRLAKSMIRIIIKLILGVFVCLGTTSKRVYVNALLAALPRISWVMADKLTTFKGILASNRRRLTRSFPKWQMTLASIHMDLFTIHYRLWLILPLLYVDMWQFAATRRTLLHLFDFLVGGQYFTIRSSNFISTLALKIHHIIDLIACSWLLSHLWLSFILNWQN